MKRNLGDLSQSQRSESTSKAVGSRTDGRVTFLARPRNVTQRRRPSSQARINNMRVPSLLLISVAAAELARKALAQTSSQKAPQKSLALRLAQMGRVSQNNKEESKAKGKDLFRF